MAAPTFEQKVKFLQKKIIAVSADILLCLEEGRLAKTDSAKISSFKGMYTHLEHNFKKFEKLWDELSELYAFEKGAGEFPQDKEKKNLAITKQHFYEANAIYLTIKQKEEHDFAIKLQELQGVRRASNSQLSLSNETANLNSSNGNGHLPRLSLPSFDGKILNWPRFKDAFSSIVHDDDNIPPIRKFHYLISSVTGPAHAIVTKVVLTSDNYPIAWQSLLDTYDKKRLLASAYLNELTKFKPIQGNKSSIASLQLFLSDVCENISALKLLNIPDEAGFILFHLAIKCVDTQTRELFEMENKNTTFPTFEALTTFVRSRCLALQLADQNSIDWAPSSNNFSNNNKSNTQKTNSTNERSGKGYNLRPRTTLLTNKDSSADSQIDSKIICVVCKGDHKLLSCLKFKEASPLQRKNFLKKWEGCLNCLSYYHSTEGSSSSTSTSKNPLALNTVSSCDSHVLLGTVVLTVEDSQGNFQSVRMVIDNGSQNSFLTIKCLNKLGLPIRKVPKRISCLGNTIFEGIKGAVSCKIRPRESTTPELLTEALVVSKITSDLPNFTLPSGMWEPYLQYPLADPNFWESRPIDGLLGCDVVSDIWSGDILSITDNGPRLFASIFGHVVMGKASDVSSDSCSTALLCASTPDICEELERFWELEEVPNPKTFRSAEDELAEQIFVDTHYRTPTGRYVVSLPFRNGEPDLGPSYGQALRSLHNLEQRFRKNPSLHENYREFMQEYNHLGHMSLAMSPSKYLIPHHAVTKFDPEGVTQKLRVVFNASAQTSNGSLNDYLIPGPKLQADLRIIMACFRLFCVVFTADGVKMFRQILVEPSHRPFQHILWRADSTEKVETYELETLVYGQASSPFLALRTVQQLREDEGHAFPLAASALERDLYVDDIPTGANSLEEALELQNQLIGIFAKGGLTLGKWASNRQEILDAVSSETSNSPVSLASRDSNSIKVLGLQWDPRKDCFSYQIDVPKIIYSKRAILSNIAKIFDPLGFLCPVVLLAKSFIQELWKSELDWDDPIPDSIKNEWDEFVLQLPSLEEIEIPRFLHTKEPFQYQIVGFCDASMRGYSASIYLRVLSNECIHSHLIMGKSKLAPVKTISIPRLELCGAHLLARMYTSLGKFFDRLPRPSMPPDFFTDSTVVLSWINTPPYKLKTWVANRVSEIIDSTSPSSWAHVQSEDNPCDCSSRGLLPNQIRLHSLWWTGPRWMFEPKSTWPSQMFNTIIISSLPELKSQYELSQTLVATTPQDNLTWMAKFSSYSTLLYFVATLRRFIHNHQHPDNRKFGPPDVAEIKSAEISCIKAAQLEYFLEGKHENTSGVVERYAKLSPVIDEKGLVRVGGRIKNSDLLPHQKFPILLPRNAHFTVLVIDHLHKVYLHPGPGLLQALIQLKYWVPSLRNLVKKRSFLCIRCFKLRGDHLAAPPKMGDLPSMRVTLGRTFQHIGVDFAGPLTMRASLRRNAPTSKVYVCLFVCMRTKALHIEPVTSLSTEAFLACFSRFISRRGLPEEIFSDCGTNFKGAANHLKELAEWFSEEATQKKISEFCTLRKIHWNFNPPRSPHFGGIWEAGVKSIKGHLRAVAGMASLTFEELATLLARTEAILNSRPLCPLSSSPEETDFLSPGHFLIGDHLVSNPESTLLDVSQNRLSRWQLVKQMSENIWSRWRREYLSTLQQRVKWTKPTKNLQEGDLVLLKSSGVPPLCWPLGKIIGVHPGTDQTVRVVTVRTATSVFKRSAAELVPLLPLDLQPYERSS